MKTTIQLLIATALISSCSAAYARSSAYLENGWVSGFYSGQDAARDSVPQPAVPEPVIIEPAQDGSAEDLGPALTLPTQMPVPAPGLNITDEFRVAPPDYDEATALRLARNTKNYAAGNFGGWCYSYVADAMERTGIIRREQWYSLGIGVNHAADFAYWANRNPKTLRSQLNLAKMPTPSKASDLPMGAIVVYNRGTCGFSSRSGHIEVKVAPNLLCSDGCQPAYQECFGSAGTRAGISVYVPVKNAAKSERRFCRLTGNGEGKCLYRCNDGSDYEMPMKRPGPWDMDTVSAARDFCKQAILVY